MRRSAKTTGDRVRDARSHLSRDVTASARSPVSTIPRTLEAAIDAAHLMLREPDEDGERIVVSCNALGGAFIYSKEEAERRIMLKFPDLVFDDVSVAARHLENHVRLFLKPIQSDDRRNSSWVHGWRGDY